MNFKNKKIGIWGFGKTGQSVLHFIAPDAKHIFIYESQPLSDEQKTLAAKYNAQFVDSTLLNQFLEVCDIIIPSPGVDLRSYKTFDQKFLSELDIFSAHITTKTIAITGSVGKTTLVTLITTLLNRCGLKSCAAGNIGLPILDILAIQNNYEWIVLELSSFQLEYSHVFKPTISLVTNLFPNHLDRHGTLIDYAHAKSHIFRHQINGEQVIIPQKFLEFFIDYTTQQKTIWLADDAYDQWITPALSDITFTENWNCIFAIFETIGLDLTAVAQHCSDLKKPDHRLELVGTFNEVTFYNDSKATIPEATLASLATFKNKSIILFIGGMSKGVDRTLFIKKLPKNIKHVICFGKEAKSLHTSCQKNNLSSSAHLTFKDAWNCCLNIMTAYDIVLFSPSGTSFDLFKNYEERGNIFRQSVLTLKTESPIL